MNFLPICLDIENARIVVVGGGKAAEQKLKTLLLYTRNIVVCAPEIRRSIHALPVTLIEKPYEEGVLERRADGLRLHGRQGYQPENRRGRQAAAYPGMRGGRSGILRFYLRSHL